MTLTILNVDNLCIKILQLVTRQRISDNRLFDYDKPVRIMPIKTMGCKLTVIILLIAFRQYLDLYTMQSK